MERNNDDDDDDDDFSLCATMLHKSEGINYTAFSIKSVLLVDLCSDL